MDRDSWSEVAVVEPNAASEAPAFSSDAPRPRLRREDASGPEALDLYLRSVQRLPVLGRAETEALAREVRAATAEFRRAMVGLRATALRCLALWRERRDSGRVTGILCERYRDDTSRDWSRHVDEPLRRLEDLVESGGEGPALAHCLEAAELHTDVLIGIHDELTALRGAARTASVRAERRRLGLGLPAARRLLRRASAALERRNAARQRFTRHNLRLVIHVAKRYRNQEVGFLDLIQEGNLGLMRAVEKFDPERGHSFSTYAVWWIEQALIRAVENQSRTIRVPAHVQQAHKRATRAREALRARRNDEVRDEELAGRLGMTGDELARIVLANRPLRSLEEPLTRDGGRLEDVVAAPEDEEPGAGFDRRRLRRALERGLRTLPERERSVIEWRFGLRGEPSLTLHGVGERLGLSRERVRQIQAEAFRRLRQHPEIGALAELLDRSIPE